MILKLKVRIILVFLLLITSSSIFAQQSSEVYIVHPSVGDTIEIKEKIRYGLFPFYKKSDFRYGIFYLVNGSYILSSKINDTIVNRAFTQQEIQLVQKLVESSPPKKQNMQPINLKPTEDSTLKSHKIVISTSPLSIVNRVNLSVESGIGSIFTAGIIYTHFFASSYLFHAVNDVSKGDVKGDRLQLFSRVYIGKKLNSCYLQLAGICGYYSESNFYSRPDTFVFVTKEFSYYAFGGSMKFGRQWLIGAHKHFVIDFNVGLQFVPRKLPDEIILDGNTYYLSRRNKLTAQPITDNRPYMCSNFMIGWKF